MTPLIRRYIKTSFVFLLAGLVLGIVALSQFKSNPMQEGKGMAIAGIILSAVGLLGSIGAAIFGVFGALMQK